MNDITDEEYFYMRLKREVSYTVGCMDRKVLLKGILENAINILNNTIVDYRDDNNTSMILQRMWYFTNEYIDYEIRMVGK